MSKGMFVPATLTKEQKARQRDAEDAEYSSLVVTAHTRKGKDIFAYVWVHGDISFAIIENEIRMWLAKHGGHRNLQMALIVSDGEIATCDGWRFDALLRPEYSAGFPQKHRQEWQTQSEFESDCARGGTWVNHGTPEDIARSTEATERCWKDKRKKFEQIMERFLRREEA
ncbi:MAG: hypothetical protein SFZ02_12255 [bacterium]|nr:hypothetical protein [bacterium]